MDATAITGDIGAGKSTISKLLAKNFQCELLDADRVTAELWTQENVKAMALSRWGTEILDSSGNIIKPKISRIIFTNKDEYKFCNSFLHPLIMSELERQAKNFPRVIIEIPLLFEVGRPEWIRQVIYVTASFETRAKRCKLQRGWNIEELLRREEFLLPSKAKISQSDYVINNDGELDEVINQVSKLLINF